MSEGVESNLERFNRSLREYRRLSGKAPADILLKQGGKLAYALAQRLKALAPRKGQVRAERLAALKQGEGVRVRPSVQKAILEKYQARSVIASQDLVFGKRGVKSVRRKGGRRLNLRALMVQREIGVRERGRAFLSISARYPRTLKNQQYAKSAFGPILSSAGLSNSGETLTFTWDGSKNTLAADAVAGLSKPQGRAAIALALRDTTSDIRTYVNRKMQENFRRAFA